MTNAFGQSFSQVPSSLLQAQPTGGLLGSMGAGLKNFGMNVMDPAGSPSGIAIGQARSMGQSATIGDALQQLLLQGMNQELQPAFAPMQALGMLPQVRRLPPAQLPQRSSQPGGILAAIGQI